MLLHPTKAFIDKVGVSLGADEPGDALLTWRAHYVQGHGYRFVVFMNELTKFVVVVTNAKAATLRNLPARFRAVLQETLLQLGVNPAVIDRYIADLGDFSYARQTDRKLTAQITHATEELWWAIGHHDTDDELSRWANDRLVNTAGPGGGTRPRDEMLKALDRYGLPVRRCTAFDLTVRLDLDGNDAVRRLRVPAQMTFARLHVVLQRAFGWTDSHLHSFKLFHHWGAYDAWPSVELVMDLAEEEWERPGDVTMLGIAGVKLCDYVPKFTKILYTYDFGDDWHHFIEVDDIVHDCEDTLPVLLSGHGDAPPEDVGGPGGWAEFQAVIADPDNEDHEWMTQWAKGQHWHPFDLDSTTWRVACQA